MNKTSCVMELDSVIENRWLPAFCPFGSPVPLKHAWQKTNKLVKLSTCSFPCWVWWLTCQMRSACENDGNSMQTECILLGMLVNHILSLYWMNACLTVEIEDGDGDGNIQWVGNATSVITHWEWLQGKRYSYLDALSSTCTCWTSLSTRCLLI